MTPAETRLRAMIRVNEALACAEAAMASAEHHMARARSFSSFLTSVAFIAGLLVGWLVGGVW